MDGREYLLYEANKYQLKNKNTTGCPGKKKCNKDGSTNCYACFVFFLVTSLGGSCSDLWLLVQEYPEVGASE